MDPISLDGVNLYNLVETGELVANVGDQFMIYNDDNTKAFTFIASDPDGELLAF